MAEYMDVGAIGGESYEAYTDDSPETNVQSEPGDKGSEDVAAESAEINVQVEPDEEVTKSFTVTADIAYEETNV